MGSGMFFIATLSVIFHAFSILPGYAVGKMELVEVTDQEAVTRLYLSSILAWWWSSWQFFWVRLDP